MIQLIPGWGGAGWGVAGPEADRHSGRGGRVGSSLWARHLYLFRQGAPFTEETPGLQGGGQDDLSVPARLPGAASLSPAQGS